MTKIHVCDQCKGTNLDKLIPKLEEVVEEKDIVIGCQNFCGIGGFRAVALVDHMPVIALDENDLIEKIKNNINQSKE